MEKKQWTMQEDFIFPEHVGVPVGAEMIKVTPGYTEERTEDSVRLTGIYHIAANVVFGEGERAEEFTDSAILIDDVEMQEEMGYFEYAVPLYIDLPSEVTSPLNVVATATTSELDGQGSLSVVWEIECSSEEAIAQIEEPATVALAEELEQVVEMDVAFAEAELEETVAVAQSTTYASTSFDETNEALAFIAGLEDGISTTTFRSNDVFIKNES